MSLIKYICRCVALWGALIALLLGLGCSNVFAQAKQLYSWQDDLAYLQSASEEELIQNQAAIQQIRSGIEFYLKFHPSSKIELPEAPAQPWAAAELRTQLSVVSKALESIIKEDPNRPFELGTTLVSVTSEAAALSPASNSLGGVEIANRKLLTVPAVLEVLPGVSVDHASGSRNEAKARIRGFSTTGQVPFYLDGIPVYIPYDGNVDLNRFLTSDIAEVQVEKGYSSPLMGPNGLVGSFNLVTRQPEKKIEADAMIGTGSGDVLDSSVRLGSRWEHFYLQGTFDWLQRDFIPLSGKFPLNKLQQNYERNLSDSRDEKWSGRFAWTPKGQDQYSFSYTNQKGEKNGLQYIGPNENAVYNRFWTWPYWNKNSYYLLTNTGIGESSSIKFRAYYDQFRNRINMWDDATLSTMNKLGSEMSSYDDHTQGASSEFTTRLLPRNTVSASIFFKDDTHKSEDIYPTGPTYKLSVPLTTPFVTPIQHLRDQLVSIGLQDVISLTSRLRVIVGFSADHLKGLHAETLNRPFNVQVPVLCASSPTNTSFSGCMANVWNVNPQVSASYNLTRSDSLFAIFSDRGRFPMLKESYSYGMGSAIPNPDLNPEHSRNWDIGYSHAFARSTLLQVEYFRSDLRDAIQSVYVKDPEYVAGSNPGLCPSNTGLKLGYCSQNANIGKEVHQGTEISLRSSPIRRLNLDANYAYINRTLKYDWSQLPDVSQILTSVSILPVMPKNKFVGNATVQLPYQVLGIVTFRYEGGLTLQDTTWSNKIITDPVLYSQLTAINNNSFGVVDIGAMVPIRAGFKLQAGVKNLLDRNYYYSAGYPEAGRNWYFNMRYQF
ncbi:MAG TPA: TonB-dependent receptor [Acidobacteriota bacterium]|nr:TonB-dependent receptor [Acidobacteriota bacterium]